MFRYRAASNTDLYPIMSFRIHVHCISTLSRRFAVDERCRGKLVARIILTCVYVYVCASSATYTYDNKMIRLFEIIRSALGETRHFYAYDIDVIRNDQIIAYNFAQVLHTGKNYLSTSFKYNYTLEISFT